MDFSWNILPVLTTLPWSILNHLRCCVCLAKLEKSSEHYQKYFNVESFLLLLLRIVTKGFLVEIMPQQLQEPIIQHFLKIDLGMTIRKQPQPFF